MLQIYEVIARRILKLSDKSQSQSIYNLVSLLILNSTIFLQPSFKMNVYICRVINLLSSLVKQEYIGLLLLDIIQVIDKEKPKILKRLKIKPVGYVWVYVSASLLQKYCTPMCFSSRRLSIYPKLILNLTLPLILLEKMTNQQEYYMFICHLGGKDILPHSRSLVQRHLM